MRAYVRRELAAGGKVATGLLAEVRHLEDVLLLTPRSRRLVGLPVLAVEVDQEPTTRKLTVVKPTDATTSETSSTTTSSRPPVTATGNMGWMADEHRDPRPGFAEPQPRSPSGPSGGTT